MAFRMGETVDQAASLDDRALIAKQSKNEMERLIEEFKPFLHSRTVKYSSKLDPGYHEELFSTSMMAFYEAVQNYDFAKGHFIPFANRVVCDRIIDHIRRIDKQKVPTVSLDEEDEEQLSAQSLAISEVSIRAYETKCRQESLAIEIEQFKSELMTWGITMDALVKHSPKHQKLRDTYRIVVSKVCQTPDIVQTIQQKRYFPIKTVAELTKLPQKTLERARTFIIASVIIKLGDYDYLSDYVSGVK